MLVSPLRDSANIFLMILLGMLSLYPDDKAKVVQFIHTDPYLGKQVGHNYSYAILVPYGANQFWWVFPRLATDYSGQGGLNNVKIQAHIEKFAQKIDYHEVLIDSEAEFNQFVKNRIKSTKSWTRFDEWDV